MSKTDDFFKKNVNQTRGCIKKTIIHPVKKI